MTEEVEGKKCCYYCSELIQKGQAWSTHEYRGNFQIFWHYRCNPEGRDQILIPLNMDTARILYNYLKPIETSDIEDWRIDILRALENILGE